MTAQLLVVALGVLVSVVGLVSGLIGAYVGMQNRALLAEIRQEMAELETRLVTRINGTYVRTGECRLRGENLHARFDELAKDLNTLKSQGSE